MSPDLNAAFRHTAEDVAKTLGADVRRGLTEGEARARLSRDGPNELTAKPPVNAWRKFIMTQMVVLGV